MDVEFFIAFMQLAVSVSIWSRWVIDRVGWMVLVGGGFSSDGGPFATHSA